VTGPQRTATVLLTWVALWLVVALALLTMGCKQAPDDDAPPATVNRTCGETGACEP
jgi:hypothetical protein